MIMDAKCVQSDLHALKKLYALLKNDDNGSSTATVDLLDENARRMLKNLLDAAARDVLKVHSEIIAGQVMEQPARLSKLSITTESSRSSGNEIRPDNDGKTDGLDIAFWKGNRFSPQWSHREGVVEHSKKRCRLCQKNTVNQMVPINETHTYDDDARNSKRFTDLQIYQNNGSDHEFWLLSNKADELKSETRMHADFSSNNAEKLCNSDIEGTGKPLEVDCLSKEASKAIEQIELCISAFDIGADLSNQVPSLKEEDMNGPYWFVNQTSRQVQPSNAMLTQSANNFSETSYKPPTWPATFSAASIYEGPYQGHMAIDDEYTKFRLFKTYKPSMNPNNSQNIQFVRSGLNASSILPNVARNTLLDKKSSQPLGFDRNQSDSQHKDVIIPKNRRHITATNASLQSDGTPSDSFSNRTSQQSSSRGSDSEQEYSLTDQTGEYVTSITWSESGAESPYNKDSYTSNTENDDDVYTSTSSVADRESTPSTSSKGKGYSSYDQPIRRRARSTNSSTSKKSGPSSIRKGKTREKQTGMWKRMKDKMAIIFHHHHHHHHHHHDHMKTSRKGKVFNLNRKDKEAYGEKAVEKAKKSLMHGKNQHSHFHGLMEGLLRHVRHKKQSKQGKETIEQLAKGQHGKKKNLNKSNWWKLMKQHRRTKLPNKTHLKLGLGKKKARLKALPKTN